MMILQILKYLETGPSSRPMPQLQPLADLSVSNLIVIHWENDGVICHFKLIEKISDKWKTLGTLLGMEEAQLEQFKSITSNDSEECCKKVFSRWLKGEKDTLYPKTWIGVYKLLRAIDCGAIARDLEKAIERYATI